MCSLGGKSVATRRTAALCWFLVVLSRLAIPTLCPPTRSTVYTTRRLCSLRASERAPERHAANLSIRRSLLGLDWILPHRTLSNNESNSHTQKQSVHRYARLCAGGTRVRHSRVCGGWLSRHPRPRAQRTHRRCPPGRQRGALLRLKPLPRSRRRRGAPPATRQVSPPLLSILLSHHLLSNHYQPYQSIILKQPTSTT